MNSIITIPWETLLPPFGVALVISLIGTPLVTRLARKWKLLDLPSDRRVHAQPIPRLGGVIMWLAIMIAILLFFGVDPRFYGLMIGGTLIFILGLLDDLFDLSPLLKLMGQILVAGIIIMFGITVSNLTNPFGGTILLAPGWDVFLTLLWMLLVMNTMNLLDGLDGLAAGISSIAAFVLVILSLYVFINQPDVAAIAAIVLGAALGFLYYNWHPAKIFMGDSGSHLLGFMLGALAIISGGKVATAVLVLGVPILDGVWAAIRRMRRGQVPWAADKGHLHHQLLDLGFDQRQVVSIFYVLAVGFGIVALISGTWVKLIALAVLIAATVGLLKLLTHLKTRS